VFSLQFSYLRNTNTDGLNATTPSQRVTVELSGLAFWTINRCVLSEYLKFAVFLLPLFACAGSHIGAFLTFHVRRALKPLSGAHLGAGQALAGCRQQCW